MKEVWITRHGAIITITEEEYHPMDSFTACCETCEMNWTEEEQEEETGRSDPPEHCIYCGSADVIVEEA